MTNSGRLDRGDGVELAWVKLDGRGPTVVFLPGFRSDMTGDKATALAAFCAERGQAMLRFDYSGHGASGGQFEAGTIGIWCADAMAVMDRLTEGKLILVGSSMGGWIALLAALARRDRIAALVGIAAAPDFTDALMSEAFSFRQRAQLEREGVVHLPSQYGDPTRSPAPSSKMAATTCSCRRRSHWTARCGCCTARPIRTCLGKWRCASPTGSPAPTST